MPGQAISGIADIKASLRGGPDGRRIREFRTCGVASPTPEPLPFPVYFPLITAHPASPTSSRRRYRLDPVVWPEVRRRARIESLRQLAAAYGVSHETIRRILQAEIESAP
jgi:hypothetical protein